MNSDADMVIRNHDKAIFLPEVKNQPFETHIFAFTLENQIETDQFINCNHKALYLFLQI